MDNWISTWRLYVVVTLMVLAVLIDFQTKLLSMAADGAILTLAFIVLLPLMKKK